MKQSQVHDIHSLAAFLVEKYQDPAGDTAIAYGMKLAKRVNMLDNVLEFGIRTAVRYATLRANATVLNPSRATSSTDAASDIDIETLGSREMVSLALAQSGRINTNEEQNKYLRERYNSPLARFRIRFEGKGCVVLDLTGYNMIKWGNRQVSASGIMVQHAEVTERRGRAAINSGNRMKDKNLTGWEGLTDSQLKVFESEFGAK